LPISNEALTTLQVKALRRAVRRKTLLTVWSLEGYVAKFRALAGPMLASEVLEAFLSLVDGLPEATPEALSRLNPPVPPGRLHADTLDGRGIFDHGLAVTDR